ncbi:polyhydroxyalkanoic acid system family protein [Pseudomonas sp. GM55]|uniref:polyhydroxyalkanoic acid system family protein n=1 Tax=Pseudomonas sp. GM55 TaxID=1144333 RepID=UPI000270A6EB|nr:polyhydroxyalkanoic acid system family protein [Pseudomonas sp. GM55]EJM76541.1 putative polyhydroxyalkanoic acid system protein [Pseudomonas sp. GM55]
MAKEISITRPHKLGLDAAMEKARVLVSELATQYGCEYRWTGNEVSVRHGITGITGQALVSENDIKVYVDLNFFQQVLKGVIESEINKVLDEALA